MIPAIKIAFRFISILSQFIKTALLEFPQETPLHVSSSPLPAFQQYGAAVHFTVGRTFAAMSGEAPSVEGLGYSPGRIRVGSVNHKMLLLAGCLTLGGCGKKEQTAQKNLLTNHSSGNPLTAPVDYLGAVNQARKTAAGRIDIASLQNAINLFNAQEDRYPRDLNELAEKHYIQGVPQLPAGSRFLYDPRTGAIQISRP